MKNIKDYMFKLDKRRTGFNAIGLYFAHSLLLFALVVIALNITSLFLPGNNSLVDEDLKAIFVTISLLISLVYVFAFVLPISKPFPRVARVFAIVFSLFATFFSGFYMGLLLPVMMTTMLPESE